MQRVGSFRRKCWKRWTYLSLGQRNPNSLEKLLNVGNDGPKHSGTSRATSFLQEHQSEVRAFLLQFLWFSRSQAHGKPYMTVPACR